MKRFKGTGDSRYIYQNELDKACFQHEQLLIKHLILLKIQNMMDINVDLLQWFINLLIKIPLHLEINLLLVEQLNYF